MFNKKRWCIDRRLNTGVSAIHANVLFQTPSKVSMQMHRRPYRDKLGIGPKGYKRNIEEKTGLIAKG
jgi:hypothetical protein